MIKATNVSEPKTNQKQNVLDQNLPVYFIFSEPWIIGIQKNISRDIRNHGRLSNSVVVEFEEFDLVKIILQKNCLLTIWS